MSDAFYNFKYNRIDSGIVQRNKYGDKKSIIVHRSAITFSPIKYTMWVGAWDGIL